MSVYKIEENKPSLSAVERQTEEPHEQEMLLNMGPQHPGTHGIIRLILTIQGETIIGCTPVIGYLHRGIEKILENRPILGGIRYMDNVDYLSPRLNEIAYVGVVEQLMGLEPPRRAQYIRLLVGEMQRIASHLVGLGAMAADLGAMGTSAFVYSMRDRENILSLFEALVGSRFNVNYQRVGGVLHDFPRGWLKACADWLDVFTKNLGELEGLTLENEIFQLRTQGVGYLERGQAIAYGITGPNLRASGVNVDLRVARPYMAYREIPVNVQTSQAGDCFARAQVRVREMYESIRLCRVVLDRLPGGPISTRTPTILRPPRGETYFAIESSKGELGIYFVSDGGEYPWRVKLRGPSFINAQVFPILLHGYRLSDAIAIIGSLDCVVGEIDR